MDDHHPEQPETGPAAAREPRIYVASLSDFNAGRRHGCWVSAGREPDELLADVQQMLEQSPSAAAEEWAIHDYDGFGAIHLGEYESLETVAWYAAGIGEHGLAFAAWIGHTGNGPDDDAEFDESYEGDWPSVEAYVAGYLEDSGLQAAFDAAVPAGLTPYARIDVDGLARDLVLGGDLFTVDTPDGAVWIFRSV